MLALALSGKWLLWTSNRTALLAQLCETDIAQEATHEPDVSDEQSVRMFALRDAFGELRLVL